MSSAATASPPGARAMTVIDPRPARLIEGLRELIQYRELLFFLAWRDVKVRYKQTALGVAWAILQPGLTMVVFSVFLGRLARVPSDGLPYPLFTFAALVPWQLFAHALTDSGNSVVANQTLITKVYFPRLVIPVATVLAGLVDFGVALAVLLVLMMAYGVAVTSALLALPLFVGLALITALGAGLWLSALNVQYRDVRYALPFIAQLWLFASPVAYPSSLVPERWRVLYGLNPMAGVVEGFRWALIGGTHGPGWLTAASSLAALALLVSGLAYFRRMEDGFADTV